MAKHILYLVVGDDGLSRLSGRRSDDNSDFLGYSRGRWPTRSHLARAVQVSHRVFHEEGSDVGKESCCFFSPTARALQLGVVVAAATAAAATAEHAAVIRKLDCKQWRPVAGRVLHTPLREAWLMGSRCGSRTQPNVTSSVCTGLQRLQAAYP